MKEQPSTSSASVSLKDIARACGLSVSAVSRALKNSPEVGEVTRKRVQALAQEMGYRPNAMGAGLAQFKRTSTTKPIQAALAWLNLWPKPEELRGFRHFDLYWQGALRTAAKFGYRLEEFRVSEQMPPRRLQKILRTRSIQGILIPPIRIRVDWTSFDWEQFSGISFTRWTPGFGPLHLVTSAQSANAALAVAKTTEKGYKRIGYVGLKDSHWTYLGGFLQAQTIHVPEESRLPPMLFEAPTPEPWQVERGVPNQNIERFFSWLDKWKPDAIVTEQIAVSNLLKKTGRRVPEDIGIAALNVHDMPFDAGIDQNAEEIGRVAALVVISLIQDNDRGIPPVQREILVKGQWMDGVSLPAHSRV